jgi:hypothetical protein
MPSKWCPTCKGIREIKVIPFMWDYANSKSRNFYNSIASAKIKDESLKIHYFVRKVKCKNCSQEWRTVEISHDVQDKLVAKIVDLDNLVKETEEEKIKLGVEKDKIIADNGQTYMSQMANLSRQLKIKEATIEHLKKRLSMIQKFSKLDENPLTEVDKNKSNVG